MGARDRAGGRVLRDLGSGRDQSGHRPGGRDDGLDSGGGDYRAGADAADRQRRLSGGGHLGITRSCTKHNFLVKTLADLPQAIHEAFHIAATGRPGPVLVDIPKDVFQARGRYAPVSSIHLPGYKVVTEGHAGQIRRAAQMIWEAKRPLVYAGGGIIAAGASEELRAFVEQVDAPAVCTLMALGALPGSHPNFVSMPGMHGSYAANMSMSEADLLIALGTRFDDRVTGKLSG